MKGILFILFIIGLSFNLIANEQPHLSKSQIVVLIGLEDNLETGGIIFDMAEEAPPVKFKRGKAILFTVFTGLFGGHRVYFGTHHRTPIIYSITLGGLGILPLVDLINIIFTKDLSKFDNKTQIIMWGN